MRAYYFPENSSQKGLDSFEDYLLCGHPIGYIIVLQIKLVWPICQEASVYVCLVLVDKILHLKVFHCD